jgi:hypothetical protein
MKPYRILESLVNVHSFSSFDKEAPTWTPRLLRIKDLLETLNIPYTVRHFDNPSYPNRSFTNFYISFTSVNQDSISGKGLLFLAHHDISNSSSENCQDNTASVSNLIYMMSELVKKGSNTPVHFAIVDSEEHVNVHCCGSQVLSQDIKAGEFGEIECCINLELTGNGKNIWVSSYDKYKNVKEPIIEKLNAFKTTTPYNDATVLNMHDVPAICIGILPDYDFKNIEYNLGYPQTWALCHSNHDTIDKISSDDMDEFCIKLMGLLN